MKVQLKKLSSFLILASSIDEFYDYFKQLCKLDEDSFLLNKQRLDRLIRQHQSKWKNTVRSSISLRANMVTLWEMFTGLACGDDSNFCLIIFCPIVYLRTVAVEGFGN